MLKKINDSLASMPATLIAGGFLLASFILPRMGYPGMEALAWVAVVVCGIPLLYLAIWRVVHNPGISKISSALLISIGMIAALCIGDLFAAGEVAFIMSLGALLEDMTTERAKKGLKNLIRLAPQQGRRLTENGEEMIPVEQITEGNLLRVLPGETIPVDGMIVEGESSVDQSVMTGESLPVDKAKGDTVFCGTVNRFGSVDIRATSVGEDSSLQKLIRMVQEAENQQAPVQRIADKWASWLVPVALGIAVLTWLVTGEIVRAVTVLVVFCPCALVLSTPTAIMAAIGQATKQGVIIKSGAALETLGNVHTFAFDKTGTLTSGKLTVSEVVPLGDMNRESLLSIAAAVERRSEHPLGRAIVECAQKENLNIPDCTQFQMCAGKGVCAAVDGRVWFLGNKGYLQESGIPISDSAETARLAFGREGKACVLMAVGKQVVGAISLSDTLRGEMPGVIGRLREMGVTPVLLTGDHQEAADYLASKSGIEEVRANLLPGDKVAALTQLHKRGLVCMVGDGVNDAPALKTADVGIAMGAMGSDIAVEAADVALMTDDLSKLPYLKWLSDTTVKTIRGAITLSMCINFVAVTLSVIGVLTPTTGALVHNAGSCFVILLAALLYDKKYQG